MQRPPLDIPIVLGSIRRNRRSHAAAQLIAERVVAAGCQTQVVDLRELALPMYDEEESSENHAAVTAFRQRMAAADATIWLTPEYNHSFTSAVKNATDYLHTEIRRKPAAVCGLSAGATGGARAVEQFKLVLIELHAVPIRESVYFSDARTLFDAEGNAPRPDLVERIDYLIASLVWYARALDWGREHLPIPERPR